MEMMKQEIATEASTQAATKAAAQATIPCSLHDLPMYGECFWSLNNRGEYSPRAPDCNECGINCKEKKKLQQILLVKEVLEKENLLNKLYKIQMI